MNETGSTTVVALRHEVGDVMTDELCRTVAVGEAMTVPVRRDPPVEGEKTRPRWSVSAGATQDSDGFARAGQVPTVVDEIAQAPRRPSGDEFDRVFGPIC